MNIINPYRFGEGGVTPPDPDEFQPETIAYMNAIQVPNDSSPTPYALLSSDVWLLFDSCIVLAKNYGIDLSSIKWHPMYGITTSTLGFEAMSASTIGFTFGGAWNYSPMGNKGNGVNTVLRPDTRVHEVYGVDNFAVTMACNSNEVGASTATEYGARGSNTAYISFSLKRDNNKIRGFVGDSANIITTPVTTSEGITSLSRFSGTQKLWRDGIELTSGTASGSQLPNVPPSYGAYMNGGSPIYFSNQRLLSLVTSKGDDATVQVVHQMIDMWEAGLGRKTW